MEPDVGRVPNCDVRLFPFYNFRCLTGCENRKCNFAWEVLNFWHIWGTENFRFDKQMHGFNGVSGTENLLVDAEASVWRLLGTMR